MFERSVQLRRSVWKSEKSMCCGQIFKRPWSYKNKPKVQKVPLKLDSTSSSGCKISNCNWFSLCLYWCQHQTKPLLKLLFKFSVRELYNSTVIPPEEGGLKEVRDKANNSIIGDSTLCNVLPPQLKIWPLNTKLGVSGSVAYMPKEFIHNYHYGVSFFWKT